ncbi:hypothetical protein [Streptomyces neyagawaensis]|nr:hypothetical protein [Streptomyces neyagawaensis]MCL6732873.1 hypothetical protein [Streptomyces neyagawaensis]MDE1681359.1 hypothetical protein [Streptomyces neyagawaensis]
MGLEEPTRAALQQVLGSHHPEALQSRQWGEANGISHLVAQERRVYRDL